MNLQCPAGTAKYRGTEGLVGPHLSGFGLPLAPMHDGVGVGLVAGRPRQVQSDEGGPDLRAATRGLPEAGNEIGTRMALAKLAALVESK